MVSKIIDNDSSINNKPQINQMPPYTLRKSARAKRLSLSVTPDRGLEVVMPKRATEAQALKFLMQNKEWVMRHSAMILAAQKLSEIKIPDVIHLPAANINFNVSVLPTTRKRWFVFSDFLNDHLELINLPKEKARQINDLFLYKPKGDSNLFNAIKCLRRWLREYAEEFFPQVLDRCAKAMNINYNKLSVRSQRRIWGSCDQEHNISLNDRLLFVDLACVEYVCIHELAHTIEANHSKRFWKIVASYCPDYKKHKQTLHAMEKNTPDWCLVKSL